MKKSLGAAVQQELSRAQVTAPGVEALFLDEKCYTKDLEDLAELTGLQILSLNNVGLQSLNGAEKLTNLIQLSVSDNKISGGLDKLQGLTELRELDMCNNKISSLDELLSLKNIPKLEVLDIESCPVSSTPDLRGKLFAEFKALTYLNGTDKDGKEREELYQDDEDDDDDGSDNEDEDESDDQGFSQLDEDEEGGDEAENEDDDEEDDSQQDEQETTVNANKRPLQNDVESPNKPSKAPRLENNDQKGEQ